MPCNVVTCIPRTGDVCFQLSRLPVGLSSRFTSFHFVDTSTLLIAIGPIETGPDLYDLFGFVKIMRYSKKLVTFEPLQYVRADIWTLCASTCTCIVYLFIVTHKLMLKQDWHTYM